MAKNWLKLLKKGLFCNVGTTFPAAGITHKVIKKIKFWVVLKETQPSSSLEVAKNMTSNG